MNKTLLVLSAIGIVAVSASSWSFYGAHEVIAQKNSVVRPQPIQRPIPRPFEVQVLVNGIPLTEYPSHGRSYVEATAGAEYELRIRNPLPVRVAVALSVDGLNSIDARRTSAWEASKWVIGPYQTIHISGWQMSSDRARRFYFTTERDSYAARIGQPGNLGVISAVFFRERTPVVVPITPAPTPREKSGSADQQERSMSTQAQRVEPRPKRPVPSTSEDYAATGIGRSVRHEVRWINLDLEPRPAAEMTIRYEYYDALVRLGIRPRQYMQPDPLRRRESARGFEDRRFSPEP